jgi:hypothetical protein
MEHGFSDCRISGWRCGLPEIHFFVGLWSQESKLPVRGGFMSADISEKAEVLASGIGIR